MGVELVLGLTSGLMLALEVQPFIVEEINSSQKMMLR